MADDLTGHFDQLNKLAPAARERVSNALKASLEAELAVGNRGKAAAEFSKGAFFSRSRGAAGIDDQVIFDKAASMDQQAFAKFAQNLQTIKGLKGGTPG
jgi:hypothetical protein